MTEIERWRAIDELFARAVELPVSARRPFLEEQVAARNLPADIAEDVLSLLEHDVSEAPLTAVDAALAEAAAGWVADQQRQKCRLGPYRLLEVLGEGGMGTVWLAERDDSYHQRVAIKISRLGALSARELERFRAERQFLAQLEHPAIARLLDGGETPDGIAYLVLELVEGLTFFEHVRHHQLDLRTRLGLFLEICDAVEHAHRRLIVHRDLKPANLLVDKEGRPKLVDFGIAKLLTPEGLPQGERTALGERYYSAGYASPEQIRGEQMTTASDVFSLGVILGELVHLAEHESVDRDLEIIVACARAEESGRRYGSVAAFADDLRHFLAGRPIAARPSTWTYRTRRFVVRHSWGVAVAALMATAILAFVLALAGQNVRIERERDRAQQAEIEAREVAAFLARLFQNADPRRSGGDSVSARQLLDQGASRLEEDRANSPAVRAALLRAIGIAYRGLGAQQRGIELLEQALALHGPEPWSDELEVATTLEALGDGLRDASRFREAEPLIEKALAIRRLRLPADHLDLAESLNDLGLLALQTGRFERALELLEASLAIRRQHAETRPSELAVSLSNLSQLANEEGRLVDAERFNREALELRRRTLGPEHPLTANSLHGLARTLERLGRMTEAEALVREAMAVRRKTLGVEHPETATIENTLASLLQDQGQLEEAEVLYRQALATRREVFGERHIEVAFILNNLASLLEDRGHTAEAEPLLATSLEIRIATFGPDHLSVARARNNLGRVLAANGQVDRGLALMAQAEARRRALLPGAAVDLALSLVQKARILNGQRLFDEARAAFQEAWEIQSQAQGKEHPVSIELRAEVAAFRARHLSSAGCDTEITLALTALEKAGPAFEPARARVQLHLGDCLSARGEKAAAHAAWSSARVVLESRFGPDNPWVRELRVRLKN